MTSPFVFYKDNDGIGDFQQKSRQKTKKRYNFLKCNYESYRLLSV